MQNVRRLSQGKAHSSPLEIEAGKILIQVIVGPRDLVHLTMSPLCRLFPDRKRHAKVSVLIFAKLFDLVRCS